MSYFSLFLTKVLFEISFKSFEYNTEDRRLSNYLIKLILCSRFRLRCKGLCQKKKHEFDQYTKGGHFCAAHMALITNSALVVPIWIMRIYSHHSVSIISFLISIIINQPSSYMLYMYITFFVCSVLPCILF